MSTTPAGGRSLHDSLRLLTDARRAYQHSGDADRRLANQAFYTRLDITDDEQLRPKLANQAFYTRLDITDDEQLRPKLAEPFATIFREAHDHDDEGKEAKREHTTSSDVACSHKTLWVVSEVPNWNHLRRLDRLDSAWIQGSSTRQASPPLVFD